MFALSPSSLQLTPPRPNLSILRPLPCLHRPRPPNSGVSFICHHHRLSSKSTDDDPYGHNPLNPLTLTAVFLALGFRFASGALVHPPPALASAPCGSTTYHPLETQDGGSGDTNVGVDVGKANDNEEKIGKGEKAIEDKKLEEAFEKWKSKSYSLTVPLSVVALRGSVPPPWIKDFLQSQGKRVRLQFKFSDSLGAIFSNLSTAFNKGNVKSTSPAAADVVSVGDSWLTYAIKIGLIESINGAEDQEWFSHLSDKWKIYLRRNSEGDVASEGTVWAAPYRWGCMVVAYKKSKFEKLGMAPIEDWKDLWRPELGGRISMVDCPREVIGTVLKYMGASYNTNNLDCNVAGGMNAIQQNLALLAKQVRLFDSKYYLKAFGVDDVWVAVGWSSDVIPAAKRLRNIAVIVPKSGASLWADLWAIPVTSGLRTSEIGGRIRGASPLVHQWMEFCSQPARALPFRQGVLPGAIPSTLDSHRLIEGNTEFTNRQPKLDTNLVAGVSPSLILSRCEFLERLSDTTVAEYEQLIKTMPRPGSGFIKRWQNRVSMLVQTLEMKLRMKVDQF